MSQLVPLSDLVLPSQLDAERQRHQALAGAFHQAFPQSRERIRLFSSPGRTEVAGNHTDHQRGRVLAAAIDLDILFAAAPNQAEEVRLISSGYPLVTIRLDELSVRPSERFSTAALVRGICSVLRQSGKRVAGFDVCVDGQVPAGAGLSSSAAFEVGLARVVSELFNTQPLSPMECALAGQRAENEYFGKPCGLMDQAACALGGCVFIDFANLQAPEVRSVPLQSLFNDYTLLITNTGGSHAELNAEYEALEHEMKIVAQKLGHEELRAVTREVFLEAVPRLRGSVSDRALLRAFHYFEDDARVIAQEAALREGANAAFLRMVRQSGESSFMYCQNCYCPGVHQSQEVAIGLMLSHALLGQEGAWRVHGGGFAGTIAAFVPKRLVARYRTELGKTFGTDAVHAVTVRKHGAVEINAV
ncbi:MAG: galactokinase family protein [Polyangiaceae bacterium]|nr:galactokinase family protein [Polyangiaceae bacterium]